MNKRELKRAMKKSIAVLLSVAVFAGTIEFYSYDHFGLDNDDYEWFAGFCDWFTLQHYDRFNGKYVPFITVVETSVNFEGVIE